MATLTPIITGTPGYPPSYNVGMAETFSWVPIENDVDRPLFARAMYLANPGDIKVSLSAGDMNLAFDTTLLETAIGRTNTLLNSVTSNDNRTITLLGLLTASTDGVEGLISTTNSSLTQVVNTTDGIEGLISTTNSSLTQVVNNTDGIEGLISTTNSSLTQVSNNTDGLEGQLSTTNSLLVSLTSSGDKLVGFSIPPYDEIVMTYVGSTNNLDQVVYKNTSTAVLTLSFTYTETPPTSNNALLQSVKKL